MLPNMPQFTVTMVAIPRAGYVCVNVNPLYTSGELEHQLRDSGASTIVIVIVIQEKFASVLQEVVENTDVKHIAMAAIGDLLGPWRGPWVTLAARHLAKMIASYKFTLSDQLQVISFRQAVSQGAASTLDAAWTTSHFCNTTAAPLAHQKALCLRTATSQGLSCRLKPYLRLRSGEWAISVKVTRLQHYRVLIFFALTLCILAMRWGSTTHAHHQPPQHPRADRRAEETTVSGFPEVNTLFNALMTQPQFKTFDFSNQCMSQAGGMAASERLAKQWFERETCAICTNNPVNSTHFSGSIGVPLPSIDIAIKTDAGESTTSGELGEISMKGPQVMTGYYQQ